MNPHLILGLPLFLVAFLNCLLAIFVLKKTPRSNLNKAVAVVGFSATLYALFAGIVYTRAAMGLNYDVYYRACHVGWFALPAFYQVSCYIKDDKSRQALVVGIILYAFWLLIDTLNFTSNWIETGVYTLIPFHPKYGPFEKAVRLLGGFILVVIIYRIFKVRNEVTGVKKTQLNYFILGSIIYAIGGALGAGFFSVFGGLGIDPALGSYFSLPWLALTFYAITRYRLFDIQIIISSTLAIAILTLVLGGIDIVLLHFLTPYIGFNLALYTALLAVIIIFLRTPLRNVVQGGVNDIFLGDKYNYQVILRESTQAIISILDQDELLNHLVHAIQQSFKIHKASLFLKNSQNSYTLSYTWGLDKRLTPHNKLGEDPLIEWFKSKKQIFIKEEQEALMPKDKFNQVYGNLSAIEAELILPLFFKDNLIGFLSLGPKDDQRPYVQSDIDILLTLASQTAIAIENSRLYSEAIRDSLTGLYHHKYFKMRLREEIEHSKRYGFHEMSLLIIDIDHFKNINDICGHLVGDKVLLGVVDVIKMTCREVDIIARYGGEEFVVIAPHTDKQSALILADRIRKNVENMKFEGNIMITASLGVCTYQKEKINSVDDFIELADKALYRAKQNGRNRIEVAETQY